jgi:hypothetical protein
MPTFRRFERIICFIALFLSISTKASAGPYSDTLGKALVSATTPADRVILVRWLFTSLSLHPGVQDLIQITPKQKTEANQAVAKLIERLLTVSCRKETIEAVKYEGTSAIESSFNLLGQIAGREAFGDPHVTAGLAELKSLLDVEKFKKALDTATNP